MATEANTQKLREEGGDDTLKRAEAMAANMIDIASDLLLDNDVMYGMRDAISHMYGAAKQLKHENPDIDAERFHEYLALCDVKYMVGAGFPIEVIHADCLRYYDQGIRSRLESCAAIALTEAGATYDADVMLGLCHDSNHPNSYKFALLGCWENATLEQVQQFEPLWHFLPREEIRYVKKYYEYTLSALSDDTDTLAQNIREATLTPDISLQLKELSDRHPASKMLEQLVSLDRGKAETVCFEVLQTLGQRSDDRITTTLDNTEPYINMLAESNNPEYLNCALGVIDNATATFSQKILATAKLAKKLELRKSPGNN